jgi:hypothetical protein
VCPIAVQIVAAIEINLGAGMFHERFEVIAQRAGIEKDRVGSPQPQRPRSPAARRR